MKVLLHGAINASNFGDYLFAEMFYHFLQEHNVDTFFYNDKKYGISNYFKEKLGYNKKWTINDLKDTSAFVYISGGYFCEIPRKHSIYEEICDIRRYILPAFIFMRKKIPIYILGVGAGPFTDEWFSKLAIKILNTAKIVTVRDSESELYCRKFGVRNHIEVTSDTALLVKDYIDKYKVNISDGIKEKRKILLLHIDSNTEVKQLIFSKIEPVIKQFLREHNDYCLYLAADGIKNQQLYKEYYDHFSDYSPNILYYDDPWVLCKQIMKVDTIITTKLHVGIVSCSMGTSVLSFPNIPNKTIRFYKQIGELNRCIPLREVKNEDISLLLDKYAGVCIKVPDELKNKAKRNLELLPH